MNNLEFDHADIFDDLKAIQRQFHHLVRTVPGNGRILAPKGVESIDQTLEMGCWSELEYTGEDGHWQARKQVADGSRFDVYLDGELAGVVNWDLVGDHNVSNALMAIAAARHVGVTPDLACESLATFINTKRRLELKGEQGGVKVYDDFAHHPTAVELTLGGLRAKVGSERILAVLEPRSNTMKLGVHKQDLAPALQAADEVFIFQPDNIPWSVEDIANACSQPAATDKELDSLVAKIVAAARPGDNILVMSNGGFGGIHDKLLAALAQQER